MRGSGSAGRPWLRLVAVVAATLALAAACGSDGDDGDEGGSGGTTGADVTIAASGDPTPGGSVIYGLEAENSGYNALDDRWAIAGIMTAGTVYDPMSAYDADGNIQPYLAESFTPNDDFTSWTVKLRSGITFSNGQPLTGEAGANFLRGIAAAPLTGGALKNVDTVETDPSDPLAFIVDMKAPWASFPTVLVGQAGMIPAPEQLDAALAGDKEKASRNPIGTGPFILKEWIPDNRFVATKNPDYWRTDDAGNALPYLDEVEFRPIPDAQTRVASLEAGTITMMHTSSSKARTELQDLATADDIQLVEDRGENEETFVMLNTSAPPFDNVLARRAVAFATDPTSYFAVTEADPALATNSAFGKDSPYYFDSDFPGYDPAEAERLVQEYTAETGQPLAFDLGTTPVTENQQIVQLLAEQYNSVGMNVTVKGTEQGQFIVDAATGNYQANLWRQFGATDPDGDYLWWHKDNATGGITLNFARFANDELSAALDEARATPDQEVRKQAYQRVQEIWADQVPYVWLSTTVWAIGAANNIRNIANGSLPDGQPSLPFQSGSHRLTQTWIEQ
jgi:peptide/nickel transport system substrate-binding protein